MQRFYSRNRITSYKEPEIRVYLIINSELRYIFLTDEFSTEVFPVGVTHRNKVSEAVNEDLYGYTYVSNNSLTENCETIELQKSTGWKRPRIMRSNLSS